MLKTAIIAAAILIGAGGILMRVTHVSPRAAPPGAASGMPSIEELHARAARQDLSIQEVKEPY
jgi:hypothetical protein